ncbi:hypothetical protein EJ08DRAFT_388729 [Tothia fuscella]|uniref:Rad60/SUMO-like domain-containing protein n=1 Tax=Tothia fuscella TaxID=1048955 RepID=A0A9P4NZ13_9PEZI|nr:hypothetical protein EJ08DRAFT_388729 [Tothia fuscella]
MSSLEEALEHCISCLTLPEKKKICDAPEGGRPFIERFGATDYTWLSLCKQDECGRIMAKLKEGVPHQEERTERQAIVAPEPIADTSVVLCVKRDRPTDLFIKTKYTHTFSRISNSLSQQPATFGKEFVLLFDAKVLKSDATVGSMELQSGDAVEAKELVLL